MEWVAVTLKAAADSGLAVLLGGVAGGLLGALAFLYTWFVEQRARTLRELLTQGLEISRMREAYVLEGTHAPTSELAKHPNLPTKDAENKLVLWLRQVEVCAVLDEGHRGQGREPTRLDPYGGRLAAKALKGHATGAAPFGYSLKRIGDEKSGHSEFVINEAQANVVRRVFALAAQGYGARKICNTLNAEGIKADGAVGVVVEAHRQADHPSAAVHRGTGLWRHAQQGQAYGQMEGREADRDEAAASAHRRSGDLGQGAGPARAEPHRVPAHGERAAALEA